MAARCTKILRLVRLTEYPLALLSLSGVASWVLPPGVVLIGVSRLILEL